MSELLVRGVRPYGTGDPVDLRIADGVITEIGRASCRERVFITV